MGLLVLVCSLLGFVIIPSITAILLTRIEIQRIESKARHVDDDSLYN